MRTDRPGGKIFVATLIVFILSVTQLRNPDPLLVYILTGIPAGWFMFNALIRRMFESDGFIVFGPIGEMIVFHLIFTAIKVTFKLMISAMVGIVALPYAIVVWVTDLLPRRPKKMSG